MVLEPALAGFALQEFTLVIAIMLGRFDLELDDPSYERAVEETLPIKT